MSKSRTVSGPELSEKRKIFEEKSECRKRSDCPKPAGNRLSLEGCPIILGYYLDKWLTFQAIGMGSDDDEEPIALAEMMDAVLERTGHRWLVVVTLSCQTSIASLESSSERL